MSSAAAKPLKTARPKPKPEPLPEPEREPVSLPKKPLPPWRTEPLSKDEAVLFLTNVILTPAGLLTEDSPLCQEHKEGREGVTLKMPCKLSALEKLVKLQGWNESDELPEGLEDTLAELMRRIRGGIA